MLSERLSIPVTIENDSRAMAYGEYMAGVVQGEKNILFINLNWGLGSGIIIDGKLYYGKSGFAGEMGHINVLNNEILCKCGKKGCLETEISGYAILRLLQEHCKKGSCSILSEPIKEQGELTLTEFVEDVQKEDILAIEIVEHISELLGRRVSGMINIFISQWVSNCCPPS